MRLIRKCHRFALCYIHYSHRSNRVQAEKYTFIGLAVYAIRLKGIRKAYFVISIFESLYTVQYSLIQPWQWLFDSFACILIIYTQRAIRELFRWDLNTPVWNNYGTWCNWSGSWERPISSSCVPLNCYPRLLARSATQLKYSWRATENCHTVVRAIFKNLAPSQSRRWTEGMGPPSIAARLHTARWNGI